MKDILLKIPVHETKEGRSGISFTFHKPSQKPKQDVVLITETMKNKIEAKSEFLN